MPTQSTLSDSSMHISYDMHPILAHASPAICPRPVPATSTHWLACAGMIPRLHMQSVARSHLPAAQCTQVQELDQVPWFKLALKTASESFCACLALFMSQQHPLAGKECWGGDEGGCEGEASVLKLWLSHSCSKRNARIMDANSSKE